MQESKSYPENEAFEKWRLLEGEEKEHFLASALVPLLRNHAYSVCWLRAPDHKDEFEGIIYESIWRAITKAKDFRGDAKFGTWFHRIVLNECNRVLKGKQTDPTESLEAITEELGKETNPEKAILLRELVGGLDQEDKELLELELRGYSAAEIGEKLEISEYAAWQRLSRVKEKLRARV